MNKPAIDHNRVSSTVQNKGPAVLIPAPPQSTTQPAVVDHNRVSSTVQNKGPAVLIPAPPQSTTQPAAVLEVSSSLPPVFPMVLNPASNVISQVDVLSAVDVAVANVDNTK
jgi:hypothetical protein